MGLERLERLSMELQMKKKYFAQRKGWAYRLAEEKGLTKPGQNATAQFGNRTYTVEIGPRGGMNVGEVLPWQIDSAWFSKSASQRKKG